MKQITKLIMVGVFASPIIGFAQVSTTPEPRNAVIEEWTGIHCGYCPTGHAAVQTAVSNNPGRVVAVNIHSGGYAVPGAGNPDYRTTHGTAHDAAFPISGYPSSTLNRRTIGAGQTYHPAGSNDANKVPAVLAETSEVNMYITATVDIVTRLLEVDVEYYYTADAPNATNYMNVAILQNNVHGPQTTYGGGTYNPGGWINYPTVYNHMHMFRGFMTGQWGTAISSTTTGSTATLSYSQVLPAAINGVPLDLAELEIAAYIGDGFQAAGNVLTGVSVYPTLTGFTATDEVVFNSVSTPAVDVCDASPVSVTPTVSIKNWGSNPIATATITYDMNGGTPQVYNFSDAGNPIAPGATRMVTLDPITFTPIASNMVNVTVTNPNGVADDSADNSGSTAVTVNYAIAATDLVATVYLTTDRYASETTWNIKNSAGTTIASAGPWSNLAANGTTIQTPVPVNLNPNDCYTFTILDSYGDGINSGFGAGSFEVRDGNNLLLVSGGTFTFEDSGLFETSIASVGTIEIDNVSIYPNPATNVLNVKFEAESNATVSILDLSGRVVATETGLNSVIFPVSDLSSGSYIVTITTETGVYQENVVIK